MLGVGCPGWERTQTGQGVELARRVRLQRRPYSARVAVGRLGPFVPTPWAGIFWQGRVAPDTMCDGELLPSPSRMRLAVAAPPLPRRAARARLDLLAQVRALSYNASADAAARRDLRLDLLRGFSLFAMVVDHLGGDSWLYAITGGNRFYVSAAEGFIFISGVAMGRAYQAKMERSGLVEAMTDALRRARTLYVATVVLTLVFSALYLYTDVALWTGRDFGLGIEGFDELVVAALTLHFTYHGTEILAMYTILVLLSPITLLLLSLGLWRWVLGIAWLWWLAYQAYPQQATFPWPIRNGENFPIAAWQVLFITGQVLGFHRLAFSRWLQRWPHVQVALVSLGAAFLLALISVYWATQSLGSTAGQLPLPFFDTGPDSLSGQAAKVSVRPWRVVAFVAVAITTYTLVTYLWRPLRWATGWLLLPLGQHALYGYIVHFFLILLIFNLGPYLAALPLSVPADVLNPLVQIGLVLLLWGMVRRRVLFGIVPN